MSRNIQLTSSTRGEEVREVHIDALTSEERKEAIESHPYHLYQGDLLIRKSTKSIRSYNEDKDITAIIVHDPLNIEYKSSDGHSYNAVGQRVVFAPYERSAIRAADLSVASGPSQPIIGVDVPRYNQWVEPSVHCYTGCSPTAGLMFTTFIHKSLTPVWLSDCWNQDWPFYVTVPPGPPCKELGDFVLQIRRDMNTTCTKDGQGSTNSGNIPRLDRTLARTRASVLNLHLSNEDARWATRDLINKRSLIFSAYSNWLGGGTEKDGHSLYCYGIHKEFVLLNWGWGTAHTNDWVSTKATQYNTYTVIKKMRPPLHTGTVSIGTTSDPPVDWKKFFQVSGDDWIHIDASHTLSIGVQVNVSSTAPQGVIIAGVLIQMWYNPDGGDLPADSEKKSDNSVQGYYFGDDAFTSTSVVCNLYANQWTPRAAQNNYRGTAIIQVTVDMRIGRIPLDPKRVSFG